MGKRILNLYANDEDINLARSKGMNLSSWFRELLSIELKTKELSDALTKDELIGKLKSKMALLSDELRLKDKQNKELEKEIKEIKGKLISDVEDSRYEDVKLG